MSTPTRGIVKKGRSATIAGIALLGLLAGCSGGASSAHGSHQGGSAYTGGQGSPTLAPLPGHTDSSCTPKPCAVGSDGVVASVSNITHTTSTDGRPVLEFHLRVVNGSPAELGVGPETYVTLLLADHSTVTMGPDDAPQALGRTECYGNEFMGGTDPSIFHLHPGESITVPKPLCFALAPSGAAVTAISYSDENGPAPEVVNLSR